jgi:hypothetical protein
VPYPEAVRLHEALAETDRLDSAQLNIDDVLDPKDYILIGLTLDPRTGLGAYQEYFLMLAEWLPQRPIDEVLATPDVGQRARLGGYVVPGSVQHDGGDITFVVTDGTTRMTVIDTGGVPPAPAIHFDNPRPNPFSSTGTTISSGRDERVGEGDVVSVANSVPSRCTRPLRCSFADATCSRPWAWFF